MQSTSRGRFRGRTSTTRCRSSKVSSAKSNDVTNYSQKLVKVYESALLAFFIILIYFIFRTESVALEFTLESQKEQLQSSLENKLRILRQERKVLAMEMTENAALGKTVSIDDCLSLTYLYCSLSKVLLVNVLLY